MHPEPSSENDKTGANHGLLLYGDVPVTYIIICVANGEITATRRLLIV